MFQKPWTGTRLRSPDRDHLRWAIRVGKRRESLKDSTLKSYAAKTNQRLDGLPTMHVAHPSGKTLQRQIKAWRTKFFVFR